MRSAVVSGTKESSSPLLVVVMIEACEGCRSERVMMV